MTTKNTDVALKNANVLLQIDYASDVTSAFAPKF